jgi:hypothetical protein
MFRTGRWAFTSLLVTSVLLSAQRPLLAQSPHDLVAQAVQTELVASRNDHSHWLYFESDKQPAKTVKQWVAETASISLSRVVERNGQTLSDSQQRKEISDFINDSHAQLKQRKSGQHDDEQAAEMLKMLPDAFIWTSEGQKGDALMMHFKPNAGFRPPDLEGRVFAAMEGDLTIDREQHRIVSLKGHLIHDVKIGYGLLGELQAGGTFDVERRELRPHVWEITETHVHIQGHALIFKTISEQEDDVKTHFEQMADSTSLQQAQNQLFHEPPNPGREQAARSMTEK